MGLFARRCMITGVSTGYAGAVAFVPLLEVDGNFRPTALPVWGTYDGYGSIESVMDGPASERFCREFLELLGRDVIAIDWKQLRESPFSPTTLADILKILERALFRCEGAVTCEGRAVSFALLNCDVAEELLLELPTDAVPRVDCADLARLACGVHEPALSVFDDLRSLDPDTRRMFASALSGLVSLNQWLDRNSIAWCPPRDAGQYSQAEALGFLSAARSRFASEPLVIRGLQRYYENEIQFESDLP